MILIRRICFLVILIIVYIVIVKLKSKDVFSEKINLNLNDEIGIIIYNDSNLNFVLKIDKNLNKLILLSYDSSFDKIKNIFNLDNIDILISDKSYVNTDKYYDMNKITKLDDFYVKDDNYILRINNYNLCIINNDNFDISNCTFSYFNYIPITNINFNDSNKVVFYSDAASDDFKEMIYTKWLDIYELNKFNYTILKVKKDNYNIINIPV